MTTPGGFDSRAGMNHQTSRHAVRFGSLAVSILFAVVGCEKAPPDPAVLAATPILGPAGEGGDPEAGEVWQQVLAAWPREGNLAVLYGSPPVQGQMDAWMMGQIPPAAVPEIGVPVMAKVRAFNDRLIGLAGRWGAVPEPGSIRGMAVRGIRKTLWSDARLAVAEGDSDRLVDVLVVMATLPRVSHVYDASADGVLVTIGLLDGFTWAMRDAATEGFDIQLDEAQCERLREAAAWIELPNALGVAPEGDEKRASIMEGFESRSRPLIRQMLTSLCG